MIDGTNSRVCWDSAGVIWKQTKSRVYCVLCTVLCTVLGTSSEYEGKEDQEEEGHQQPRQADQHLVAELDEEKARH